MNARRLRHPSDRGLVLFMVLSMGVHIAVFAFSRMSKSEPRVVAPVYNVKLVTTAPGGGPRAKEASAKGNPNAKAPPVAEKAPAPKPKPAEPKPVAKSQPAPPKSTATKAVPKETIKQPVKKDDAKDKAAKAVADSKADSKKNGKAEKAEPTQDLGSALSAVKNLIKDKRGHEAGAEGAKGTSVAEFGSGEGGAQAGALALQIYVGQVQTAIQSHWSIPGEIARLRIMVQLGLKVGPDGRVLDVWVDKGSGNRAFDESAMRAVRAASPLPVPPETKNGFFEFYTRFTPEGARSN
jgi:TonB family protein